MTVEAVLLDLGGVVVDIDFRRVFTLWSEAANVGEQVFYDRWSMDAPYEQHEIGALPFADYRAHLERVFDVRMTPEAWRDGWNAIHVGLFPQVMVLLPEIRQRMPLFAFTNTNATHEAYCRRVHPEVYDAFDHVFVSSRIRRRKPYRQAYDYVVDRIGVPAENILFLDDNKDNVEGARAIGLNAQRVKNAEEVANHLAEVLANHPD